MSVFLVRLGLRPIHIESPRQEYIRCLDAFFDENDRAPLVDLYLQRYPR
jgi:hypothetical protein